MARAKGNRRQIYMAKKTTPVITHAEILSRALRSIEAEIDEWRVRCNGLPKDEAKAYFDAATNELQEKKGALKAMYLIECGTYFT
jgi:hypothetical protein